MSGPSDRLEEYLDGLLCEEECREIEARLARDPALREELASVRRFDALLRTMPDPDREEAAIRRVLRTVERAERRRPLRLLATLAAGAALAAGLLLLLRSSAAPGGDPVESIREDWIRYGKRLGAIAAERRQGRVPRIGLGDLETPPAKAAGIVYSAALGVLGVTLDGEAERRACARVVAHAEKSRLLGSGVAAEAERSDLALRTYRALRSEAGAAAADAFYDLHRPGVADLPTARRVHPDALSGVAAEAYVRAYREAVADLERRYGAEGVGRVLERLAPSDARQFRRDASDDGVARDAVLSVRARLYRAAESADAKRLYVALR